MQRLLLIGWEIADWKILNPLLDAGELPALNDLLDSGVIGDVAATQPFDSAAQWTTLATGKRPWRHGITHSVEYSAERNEAHVITHRRRRATAIWEALQRQGIRSVAIGWPATHGSKAPGARIVSDRYPEPTAAPGIRPWPPAIEGTYCPSELGSRLDPLRVSPEQIGADVVAKFIPEWQKIDQQRDRRIGQLRVALSADFSHFGAAVHLLECKDWDFATVRFPAIGATARLFSGFAPPRRSWISEGEFKLYQGVVRAHFQLLDQMLARLRDIAGADTTLMVVSAQGMRLSESPSTSSQSRISYFGALALGGSGIVRDGLLHGATALDVAPTILTRFGLPIGEDMEGRVLVEAFEKMPDIKRIPTWEIQQQGPGAIFECQATPHEPPGAKILRQQATWNYAQSCLEAGRIQEALPKLEALFQEFPERADFAHALFQCQLNLKRIEPASETLEVLVEAAAPGVSVLLPRAELALAKRDMREARRLVNEALQLHPTHPSVLRGIGLLLLRVRDWTTLAKLAHETLQRDPSDPVVWLGLAASSLRLNRPEQAEAAARRAIQLHYFLPDAHFILARALVAQSKWEAARECMAALIKLQPDNKSVAGYHRRLDSNRKEG